MSHPEFEKFKARALANPGVRQAYEDAQVGAVRRAWRRRARRRHCFHHDYTTGESWITSHLIDVGRRKLFECSRCHRIWIV